MFYGTITPMRMFSSVAVTGSIAYDDIMNFPGKFVDYLDPEKLHQINVSFVVDRLEKQLGGTATNIAYNFILSQFAHTKVLAGMGKDHREFTEFFEKHAIDWHGSEIDKTLYTATGKAITDTSDNQIWGFYYGACKSGEAVNFKKHTDADTLYIIAANHPNAFLHAQKEAIRLKRTYVYDPGMSLTWITDADLKTGIDSCAYLVGNDYEIAQIVKRIGVSINELIARDIVVITTLGADGVRYESSTETLTIPAFKDTNIVDPTGAGDAWRGGFFGRLNSGDTLKDSLAFANALASFAVEQYGTVNHKPTFEQVVKRRDTVLSS